MAVDGRGCDLTLIADDRFSGGTHGFCVGHVTPEPKYTSRFLAKYAKLAQGAETGAITNF